MDPDKEVVNKSQNMLDNEEPNFYRYAIMGSNAVLWHTTIEAEMDALRDMHNRDVAHRPAKRKIIHSK
jgi:hypothetical protein